MLKQDSDDPFLYLATLSHPSFSPPIRLVDNIEQVISRGETYEPFPFKVTLAPDDGETARSVRIVIDNVSLELIEEIRTATTPIDVTLETVLASAPDSIQIDIGGLKMKTVIYDRSTITATLIFDDFLNTELTSEKYGPQNFPGLF